jgi:cysteinyl-tRNA synthetase
MMLFNTMTRKMEEFKPLNDKEVSLYTCGLTVYNYAHIGNLRTYIFEDILKRALIFNGYKVKHVMNITDVGHLTGDGDAGEDKIEKSAKREAKTAAEIAEFYTEVFKQDIEKLNIIEPDIWAKATDYIEQQIAFVKKLDEKGYLYKISDGMYFDTSKVKNYGQLAKLNLDGQEEGARVEVNKEKKNPTDFAVWKFSPADEQRQMEWESPWGKGFPGWHLECSAMSIELLGETIDIHCGGTDHIPVHHTNEIAQSEAVTGKQFVKYWLHGDFLVINEGRMAKSKGNFITLAKVEEKGFDPIMYRFYTLSSHYRSKLNFSWKSLENAQNSWDKFKQKFLDLGEQTGKADEALVTSFKEKIDDDLNMPQAIALAWEVFKADITDYDKRATLLEFDKVFGLNLAEMAGDDDAPAEVKKLLDQREKARKSKLWGKADELRDRIEDLGWLIEDESLGARLKKK